MTQGRHSAVQSTCETAYQWVVRDHPGVDRAQIANWAEEVGVAMELRGSAVASPSNTPTLRLGGRLRTPAGRAEPKGIGADLGILSGLSESFAPQIERKVLFNQIRRTLNEKDRAILFLLLRDASTADVATFLNASYAAAAKAMQRVKDLNSVAMNGRSSIESERVAGDLYF